MTQATTSWFLTLQESRKDRERRDDPSRLYRVLVVDFVGLQLDREGQPDCSEFAAHVRSRGAHFLAPDGKLSESDFQSGICFEYFPQMSREEEVLKLSAGGEYDAVIAAATRIPPGARFVEGGVRIGAGTANMASASFASGAAPLMNTPGFNSRATAQMVFKALLRVMPDLPLERLHRRVQSNDFDTGAHLKEFPTRKLEGLRMAVLGFGNIGREVALLARAFGMQVAVYARENLKDWVEAEGFEYCATLQDAARGASVISPHLGLGAAGPSGYANEGLVDERVFAVLAKGSVLINFDRGELVNVTHLSKALESGLVAEVAVDADVFIEDAVPVGPLCPYLPLIKQFGERVLLLPHAAADTDHPSRVAGALQAADQIIAAIRYGVVVNAVGSLPAEYTSGGIVKPQGVGRVSAGAIEALAANNEQLAELRAQLAAADNWLAAPELQNPEAAQQALIALNRIATSVRELGLAGPGA